MADVAGRDETNAGSQIDDSMQLSLVNPLGEASPRPYVRMPLRCRSYPIPSKMRVSTCREEREDCSTILAFRPSVSSILTVRVGACGLRLEGRARSRGSGPRTF